MTSEKSWKRCDCPIFASGTLNRTFKRKDTGRAIWEEARATAAEWEKAGSWDGECSSPVIAPEETARRRVTIERSTKDFLAELQETAAIATHKKYRLLLKRLCEFSENRGYVMIDQWETFRCAAVPIHLARQPSHGGAPHGGTQAVL